MRTIFGQVSSSYFGRCWRARVGSGRWGGGVVGKKVTLRYVTFWWMDKVRYTCPDFFDF